MLPAWPDGGEHSLRAPQVVPVGTGYIPVEVNPNGGAAEQAPAREPEHDRLRPGEQTPPE